MDLLTQIVTALANIINPQAGKPSATSVGNHNDPALTNIQNQMNSLQQTNQQNTQQQAAYNAQQQALAKQQQALNPSITQANKTANMITGYLNSAPRNITTPTANPGVSQNTSSAYTPQYIQQPQPIAFAQPIAPPTSANFQTTANANAVPSTPQINNGRIPNQATSIGQLLQQMQGIGSQRQPLPGGMTN